MSTDFALLLTRQLLWQAMLITSPILLVVLTCGLLVSVLQAVTQIQDSTLSFIPKMLAAILMLIFAGEWMLNHLVHFTQNMFGHIVNLP